MRKLRHFFTTALMALTLLAWSNVGWGQVIISQYYEGASNNKWIEITNLGDTDVDLTSPQLYLCLYTNTNADSPTEETTIGNTETLSGTITAGSSILYKNSSAVLPAYATGTSSSICNFNGDDLIILTSASGTGADGAWNNRIDIVGNGESWGGDKSFVRKSSILTPKTIFDINDWDEYTLTQVEDATETNTERLGFHVFDSAPDTEAPVPTFFPLDGATGVAVDVNPTITFDEAIYTSLGGVAVDNTNVKSLIAFTDGVAPVAFSATIAGNVITVVPTAELLNEQAYTLGIAPVQDEAGNAMAAPASATFTTISAAAETIELTGTYTGPYYAGEDVTVTWDAANIDNVVVEAWIPSLNGGVGGWDVVVATTPAVDGTATFTIPADAEYSTEYKLRVADVADGIPSAETAAFTVRAVVLDIASVRALTDNDEFRFDGEAVVTAMDSYNNRKFIEDATAAIFIFDAGSVITTTYAVGDGMSGLVGRKTVSNNMVRLIPLADPGAPSSTGNTVVPTVMALDVVTSADQAKLITFEMVTFDAPATFANGTNYTITDGTNEFVFRSDFFNVDYIGEAMPTSKFNVTGVIQQYNADFQITARNLADFVVISDDATLATFTLGGMDALGLTGLVVADPDLDAGATLFVDDFTGFAGIVTTPTDAAATIEVKLNGAVVVVGDLASQPLAETDIVVVTVTAEDATTVVIYKVTLTGENRELTLTAPAAAANYNTGDDIVFTWTSTNITNVNLYAVDAEEVYLINEEGPITATTGTYTYTVANGDFGTYKFRIADASDATFYYETTETSTLIDTQAPLATNSYPPLIGATDIPTSFTLLVEFDEDVQLATGNFTIHLASDGSVVQTLTETAGSVMDNMVSGDITGLAWETQYYINVTAGLIKDLSDNDFPAITDQSWKFTTMAEPTTDLFFSEYIEGSSNNKALEIYNPTAETISLDSYRIAQASNGGGWEYYHTFPVGATLAPEDVWVIITDEVDSDLFAAADADEVLGYPSVVHYNGNDARGLEKTTNGTDWVLIDVIGDPNSDADFDVAGVTGAAKDHTLVRKNSVTIGNTNWAASAGTNAEDSEWVVHPKDTFSFLGWHGKSDEAEILTFEVDAQMAPSTIDTDAATIALEVLYGTDLTALTPTFTLSLGATATIGTVEQEPGVTVVDFTNPVVYTVEAESGVTKDWTVTITEAAESTEAEIVSFTIAEQIGAATIDSDAKTVNVTVAPGTDITALVPTITVSLGATISPESGVAQNFTAPVEYTVTAQDGTTTKDWTVTVTAAGIISIYDIQYTEAEPYDSPYEGQVVTTTGIVTAHHYNYEGGSFKGFFIQDGEGAWNGLYVFNESLAEADRPKVRDSIVVTGLIEEFYTLTELTDKGGVMSIDIISPDNNLPAPTVLTTAEAAEEPWEGVLIQVKNAEYTIEADSYNVLGVNDGSGEVYVDDDMYDYAGIFTMNQSYNITGIGYYSYSNAKILPRFAADITPYTSVNTIWGESISVYPNPFTSTLYVDNVENASRVTIINLIGQQVMSVNLTNTNRAEISTSNLPSGVYLVTIVNNQGQKTVRKMIKR